MRIITSLLLICVAFQFGYTQTFQNVNLNIDNIGRSSVSWGDYDNDGDLDLAVSGIDRFANPFSEIYRNDDGNFVDIDAGITGVKNASIAWGDYDNDADLDLIVSGNSDIGYFTDIFNNDNGVFTAVDAGLPAVENGCVAWGDYDSDGDLDLLITGNWVAKVFNNEDGIFTDAGIDLGYLTSSSADWGDYDNDGDLDLAFLGDSGAGAVTKLYNNNRGVFQEVTTPFTPALAGTLKWIDFDHDGDLDLVYSGYDDFLEPMFNIYINDNGSFSYFATGMQGIALSSFDWGDLDDDGDLDLCMTGATAGCGTSMCGVFLNMGNYFAPVNTALTGTVRSGMAFADYDNDGDLDFIVTGLTGFETPSTRLFRNEGGTNAYNINTPPIAPAGLAALPTDGHVALSWEPTTDDHTPQNALYYNLRLGTGPGKSDVISAMANADGVRSIMKMGNTNQELNWEIIINDPGTYYWSVQAIDQAYCGSPFAEEQSFTINATSIGENINDGLRLVSTIVTNQLEFSVNSDKLPVISDQFSVISLNGGIVKTGRLTSNTIAISDLPSGLYVLRFDNSAEQFKFIKK